MLTGMLPGVERKAPKNDKPTLNLEAETWSDVDELAQFYELDKKVIAARVFGWLMSAGPEVQKPILRALAEADQPAFARLVLERLASDDIAGKISTHPSNTPEAIREAAQRNRPAPIPGHPTDGENRKLVARDATPEKTKGRKPPKGT